MVKNIRQELDKGIRYQAASDAEKRLINPKFKKSEGISASKRRPSPKKPNLLA